jgi:hypothetical protein
MLAKPFTACFDLEHQICSTDFYGWLVEYAHRGAREIVFRTSKWRVHDRHHSFPDHVMRRRFETMIAPGPAFLDLPSREGEDGERVGLGYKCPNILRFTREVKDFRRLKSVLEPKRHRYTVTIRQAVNDVWRNSNRSVWLRFADDIGAHVIEDYIVKPLHVHELIAHYAGAEMNFGVWGGPMYMCSLTEYPCMVFKCGVFHDFLKRSGMQYGENMPWCRENQLVYWDDDTFKNIHARFGEWRRDRN